MPSKFVAKSFVRGEIARVRNEILEQLAETKTEIVEQACDVDPGHVDGAVDFGPCMTSSSTSAINPGKHSPGLIGRCQPSSTYLRTEMA